MIYEMVEVHFLRSETGRDAHAFPFRRTLFTKERLANAEATRLDVQSGHPDVIKARGLVGIKSVEYRVGPVEVLEA